VYLVLSFTKDSAFVFSYQKLIKDYQKTFNDLFEGPGQFTNSRTNKGILSLPIFLVQYLWMIYKKFEYARLVIYHLCKRKCCCTWSHWENNWHLIQFFVIFVFYVLYRICTPELHRFIVVIKNWWITSKKDTNYSWKNPFGTVSMSTQSQVLFSYWISVYKFCSNNFIAYFIFWCCCVLSQIKKIPSNSPKSTLFNTEHNKKL
jgi:hypothetical protein